MRFWIFMLIMNLFIPLTMIIIGGYFIKHAPKKINYLSGYRTFMSMKNQDTWTFAHNHCGKIWRFMGCAMLPISICAMLLVFGKNIYVISIFGGILCGLQVICLIISIFPTEMALRKNFDKYGRRRNEE